MATINGTAGADTLVGGGAADTIMGLASDDLIAGLGGADVIDGGTGIDTASYKDSLAGVIVDLSTGKGLGGDAQGDTLKNVENLIGSAFSDTLTGDAGDNRL